MRRRRMDAAACSSSLSPLSIRTSTPRTAVVAFVAIGAENAIAIAAQGDDVGLLALTQIALVLLAIDVAELLFPVAPDLADAEIDGTSDHHINQYAQDYRCHSPNLDQSARSSTEAMTSPVIPPAPPAEMPMRGSESSGRLGSMSLSWTSAP